MIIDRHISRIIGDELIVAGDGAHRVFLFNAPAKFIWERLCAGDAPDHIAQKMVSHFNIDLGVATKDLQSILQGWRREGLVAPEGPCYHYMLAGVLLNVYYASNRAQEAMVPLFAHVQVDDISHHSADLQADIAIYDAGAGFEVTCDGINIGNPKTISELLETTTSQLVHIAHGKSASLMSMHSAAVGLGNKCLLMPGKSGSGKSTLTAAFVAAGHAYFTDDTVILDENYRVTPLPSPLVLKGKNWPNLESFLPDIEDLPVYTRIGTDVRYWSPPKSKVANRALPVCGIIFPTFRKDAPFAVEELTAAQTLTRILEANCMIRAPISDAILDELLDWLDQVPSFAMTHNSVSEPMKFIAENFTS